MQRLLRRLAAPAILFGVGVASQTLLFADTPLQLPGINLPAAADPPAPAATPFRYPSGPAVAVPGGLPAAPAAPVAPAPVAPAPAMNAPATPVVPQLGPDAPLPAANAHPVAHGDGFGGHDFGGHDFGGHGPAYPGFDFRELIQGPINWAWWYPHGGFTAYPGLPGSGVGARSDYAPVTWVLPPKVNADLVLQKLEQLGIPLVAPEPQYLYKNPRVHEKVRLPVPKAWANPEDVDRGPGGDKPDLPADKPLDK